MYFYYRIIFSDTCIFIYLLKMSFAGGFSFHGRPAGNQWRPGADAPKMSVELTLQAQGLDDKDVLSKSDPLCILYVQVF